MAYPISNLRTDFQDINADNYQIIKTYEDKLTSAMTTGDFTEVSDYVKQNGDVIFKVVTDANWKRDITNYVLDLKNYTVTTKNQIMFCDSNISTEDFKKIDAILRTNDVAVYLKNTEPTEIDKIDVKQENGSYLTIFTNISTKNNVHYYEISDNDIAEIGESNKFSYYVYGTGGTGSIVIRTKTTFGANSYYYEFNDINTVDELKDGDVFIIKTLNTGDKNIGFFKIGEQFFATNHNDVNYITSAVTSYKTYIFVYDSKALSLSATYGDAGYIVYDSDGTELSVLPNGFQNVSSSAKDIVYTCKGIVDTGSPGGDQVYLTSKTVEDTLHEILGDILFKVGSKYTTWNSASLIGAGGILTENPDFPIQYKKKNNWLCIRGQVNINLKKVSVQSPLFQSINRMVTSSGSFTTWLKLFDLPVDYRPSKNTPTVCMGTGRSCYVVYVTTDGGVYLGRRQDNLSGGQAYNFPVDLQIPLDV